MGSRIVCLAINMLDGPMGGKSRAVIIKKQKFMQQHLWMQLAAVGSVFSI